MKDRQDWQKKKKENLNISISTNEIEKRKKETDLVIKKISIWKTPDRDDFIGECQQYCKKSYQFHGLFWKTEKEETFPKLLYEACITVKSKPEKGITGNENCSYASFMNRHTKIFFRESKPLLILKKKEIISWSVGFIPEMKAWI